MPVKKAQAVKPKLRVAIVVDPMGWSGATAEEEVASYKAQLAAWLPQFQLAIHEGRDAGDLRESDLVVYDYGGMSPGSGLMESNARHLLRWIEDHPCALVLVPSSFTYRNYLRSDLAEQGLLGHVIHADGMAFYQSGLRGREVPPNPIPAVWVEAMLAGMP